MGEFIYCQMYDTLMLDVFLQGKKYLLYKAQYKANFARVAVVYLFLVVISIATAHFIFVFYDIKTFLQDEFSTYT